MSAQINTDDPNYLIRRVRAEVRRADKLIMQGYTILIEAAWTAKRLGDPAAELIKKLDRLTKVIGGVTLSATTAVREYEESVFPDDPDRPSAVKLLLDGGDVPEPDSHALGILLNLVESGDLEGPEFEKAAARKALVWLLRQHEEAMNKIRELAKIADEIDSEDIKLPGKSVE